MNDEKNIDAKNLRRASLLIPYLHRDNNILVYIQKRADNAERHPGCFGLFGGGAEENETPEEALKREIKEELDFIPEGYKYLGRYDSERSRKDVFTLEVTEDFEKKITILEGDYGKWFSKDDLDKIKIIESDRLILKEFYNS